MAIPAQIKDKLRLPVIGSPLFLASGPELVIAQCKAGIVGSFPALNARPEPVLDEWICRIKDELQAFEAETGKAAAPFAVNQICHASNNRLEHDVEMCVKHEVPLIITSLRPPEFIVEAAHSYGGLVFHDVINIKHARKAAEEGVDGLILVCAGAGGHSGALSPFALVQEVREFFNGTILLAGSLGSGRSILGAQAIGADLAYIGTRFVASEEADADPRYKEMIVASAADDVIYSSLFTGVHGNYLKPSIANAGLDPDDLPDGKKANMNFGSGGNTEAKAWKDIWGSGQGIGAMKDAPPVAEIIDRMEAEYHAAKEELNGQMF